MKLNAWKNDKLLERLQRDAGRKMSEREIRQQKISFVMGSLDEKSDLTRDDVAKLIDEHEGREHEDEAA
ncbi:hypothetical protein DEM26_08855 [Thioclava sp. NG1]|uniref:hypothetical protein n=1 Tax=Thioclava sp. NG1 TaxID=2182426 RepID=UPI000D60DDF8|nr:hypothetical protein [Thioclava sp. NG1]PWE50049.1 hypothetical protein DEM26_08855 [Thioclava sp. NG1]